MVIESPAPSVLSKSPTTTTTTTTILHTSGSAAVDSTDTTEFVGSTKNVPSIRSGSHTDIGPRRSNEDEHICIDDLSAHVGNLYRWTSPSSFYAIFDGHGGSEAAAYLKENAVRFFFEDPNNNDHLISEEEISDSADLTSSFVEKLESCFRMSFLRVDQALANEEGGRVDVTCGTTAITALVLGGGPIRRRHLLVANVGDCRAVMCRKGVAVQMSRDHRPSYPPEKKRIEDSGGFIDQYGYLNGELAVTRALGDWYMKLPYGSSSPLTAEPEIQRFLLTEDDEFLIMGCDGIWDVLSNQDAVNLVRRGLTEHDDPQQCARELVSQALLRDTGDNVTAIVVCFTYSSSLRGGNSTSSSQRPRFKWSNLFEETGRNLRSLLETAN